MERRTKIIILISTILIIMIAAASLLLMLHNNNNDFLKAGSYSYKITELSKDKYVWDISIAKDNVAHSIIQTDFNKQYLMEFRKSIYELMKKLFSLFSLIVYTIYVFIIFIFAQHDKFIFKGNRHKKAFLIFIIATNFFLLIRFYIDFIELRHIDGQIEYFYRLIT